MTAIDRTPRLEIQDQLQNRRRTPGTCCSSLHPPSLRWDQETLALRNRCASPNSRRDSFFGNSHCLLGVYLFLLAGLVFLRRFYFSRRRFLFLALYLSREVHLRPRSVRIHRAGGDPPRRTTGLLDHMRQFVREKAFAFRSRRRIFARPENNVATKRIRTCL